jgi:Condensin II complex subunit CAP-H2 or CNDH2, N-terminal
VRLFLILAVNHNRNINLASELEEYLGELEQISFSFEDSNGPSLNFAEGVVSCVGGRPRLPKQCGALAASGILASVASSGVINIRVLIPTRSRTGDTRLSLCIWQESGAPLEAGASGTGVHR